MSINWIDKQYRELPVMNFTKMSDFLKYIENDEILQCHNTNSYSRLYRKSDGTLAKLYVNRQALATRNIATIQKIYQNEQMHHIHNIVMPISLISMFGNIIGYSMMYIDGSCLEDALQKSEISHRQKLAWFSELARIICTLPPEVHIADLHGKNVIIHPNQRCYLIDIDGFAVEGVTNYGHYLSCNRTNDIPRKYFNTNGTIKFDFNYDVWCWFQLLLKYLLGNAEWINLGKKCRIDYIDYLSRFGASRKFVVAANRLLSEKSNVLFQDILDGFPDDFELTSFHSFLQNTRWGKKVKADSIWLFQYTGKNTIGDQWP